jgi:arylsulfatase A-like enzyme
LIEENRLTVPQYLKNHGYHTACIGKWHLGINWRDRKGEILKNTGAEKGWNIDFTRPLENGPTSRGFDYFFGMDAPNYPPYCYIENNRTIGIPTVEKPISLYGVPGLMLENWDLHTVLPELEKRAVDYIRKRT